MGMQIFSKKVWDRCKKSMGKVWDFGKKSLKHIKGAYKRNLANLIVNILRNHVKYYSNDLMN